MKTIRLALVLFGLAWLLGHPPDTTAQSTTFTYQGRLQDGGSAPTGLYDFEIRLFDAANGGAQVSPTVTLNDLGVTNGLFTAALDFGANFPGADRFLQISVRPGVSIGAYTPLDPRQPITSVPYAVRSLEAAGLPTGAVNGPMLADGAVTASKLAPGAVSQLGASDGSPINAVQVNTNGLVGVGTNAPQAGLHIASSQNFTNLEQRFSATDEMGGNTNLAGPAALASSSIFTAIVSPQESGVTLVAWPNSMPPERVFQIRDGHANFTNLFRVSAVAMNSNVIAVASPYTATVTLINWSNLYQPTKLTELRDGIGGWNELAWASSLAISGNLLAIGAMNDSAVTLADISNPSAPLKRAEFKDGFFGYTNLLGVRSVALSGGLLAIAAYNDNTVTLVDVSNPISPVKRAELTFTNGWLGAFYHPSCVSLASNLLAVGGLNGLTLFDVSNPANPVLRAFWNQTPAGEYLDYVSSLLFFDGYLAAGSEQLDRVWLFDVRNRLAPAFLAQAQPNVGGVVGLDRPSGLAAVGGNLIVSAIGDELNTFGEVSLFSIQSRAVGLSSAAWVGIGTTQPAAPLHVVGNVAVDQATRVEMETLAFEAGTRTIAIGGNATALGYESKALGQSSTALGFRTVASGFRATAMGDTTVASGDDATASGHGTVASGKNAFASGEASQASGINSFASGEATVASELATTAMGYRTIATAPGAMAVGVFSKARHDNSFVWSDGTNPEFGSSGINQFLVNATGGVGIGTTNVTGNALTVQGPTKLNGPLVAANDLSVTGNLGVSGTLTGNGNSLTQLNAGNLVGTVPDGRLSANVALRAGGNTFTGDQLINGGNLGVGTTFPFTLLHAKSISGDAEISIESGDPGGHRWTLQSSGTNANVILDRSFQVIDRSVNRAFLILGPYGNVALGPRAMSGNAYATAMGFDTVASGVHSTAMGYSTAATNSVSTALGRSTRAEGEASTSMGYLTLAGGNYSTAMGRYTTARGEVSTAMGFLTGAYTNYTTALGYYAAARHPGALVWADASSASEFGSVTDNEFAIRATGGFRLSENTSQHFGTTTRQMLNLWGTKYGIGVQTGTLYFRCDNFDANDGFIWYRGGAHNDAYANAGGGSELMHLTNDGLDVNGEIHWGAANVLSVNQHGSIELGNSTSTATTPFLDFHYGVGADQDYNTRIINSGDQQLDIARIGSPIAMARFNSGGLTVNGTFVSTSDRNAKENFQPVDAQEVLKKVASLPLTSWNYKEDQTQRHLGPMAQDFHKAFGVGPDNKHIATVDADGVALAAIQGLNQKVEDLKAELRRRDSENSDLKRRLERLEAVLTGFNQ